MKTLIPALLLARRAALNWCAFAAVTHRIRKLEQEPCHKPVQRMCALGLPAVVTCLTWHGYASNDVPRWGECRMGTHDSPEQND